MIGIAAKKPKTLAAVLLIVNPIIPLNGIDGATFAFSIGTTREGSTLGVAPVTASTSLLVGGTS